MDGPGADPTNIAEPIRHLAVPVDSIHPYPGNPRTHDLPAIAASLANPKRGQYKPITVNRRTGDILAGNGTWEAARDLLGWTQIAVTWVDVDDATAAGIVAVDNRTSDLAGYDDRLLADLLGQVDDLASVGYTPEDLDGLLKEPPPPDALPDGDETDKYREQYGVIVLCDDEQQQQAAYEDLTGQGYKARVVVT